MKNGLYLVLGILLVAAVGGLLWWSPWEARQVPEPVYNGKPLSYWLASAFKISNSSNMIARLPPGKVFASTWQWQVIGDSNAVPFLIKVVKRDRWFGAAYYRKSLWPKLPPSIQQHLPPPVDNVVVRQNAATLLAYMGPIGKASIPALIRAMKEDENPGVRDLAAWALANLGERDQSAIAALGGLLKAKDVTVRKGATDVLIRIDPGAAAKALREDPDSDVRQIAAEALGNTGKGNNVAVGALTEALNDRGLLVRKVATNALLKIDPRLPPKPE
jgi:HEAT repeat protein